MSKEVAHIPYDEFAANLESIFSRVARDNAAVVVEKPDGARAVLKPLHTSRKTARDRVPSEADYAAFLASAGGWKGLVDTEQLKEDIYESRRRREERRVIGFAWNPIS